MAWFHDTLNALESGVADRGKTRDAFTELRMADEKRAETFAELSRHADALGDWEHAVAQSQGGDLVWARLNRALALGRVNEYVRAETEADALAPGAKTAVEARYRLGCADALAATGAEKNSALASDDRAKLIESYAVKALGQLQKAADRGHFKLEVNREKLKTSTDLNTVRGRDGFAALLVE